MRKKPSQSVGSAKIAIEFGEALAFKSPSDAGRKGKLARDERCASWTGKIAGAGPMSAWEDGMSGNIAA
jgi:hypothetical protein